jgi:two-component system, cell cycle sensor histidine kinase and response regulator CckA
VENKDKRAQKEGAANPRRILVMDDEQAVREVTVRLISLLGYQVVEASHGREALEFYRAAMEEGRPYDVVILDLVVHGGMGGEEVVAELLRLDPEVKAIVSSGYSDSSAARNYREHGFCATLPKPYQLADLTRVLRQILGEGMFDRHFQATPLTSTMKNH